MVVLNGPVFKQRKRWRVKGEPHRMVSVYKAFLSLTHSKPVSLPGDHPAPGGVGWGAGQLEKELEFLVVSHLSPGGDKALLSHKT